LLHRARDPTKHPEGLAKNHREPAACLDQEKTSSAVESSGVITPGLAVEAAPPNRRVMKDIEPVLGQPRFENEIAMRASVPGVATGLADEIAIVASEC
jgi:hypothetical protein